MTLRQYLVIMGIATILCWIAWTVVLMNIDPFQSPTLGFVFFYLSLFLALIGTISIALFWGYHFLSREELPMFRYVQKSFRLGMVIAFIILGLLYLQSERLLRFWNFLAFVSFIVVLLLFQRSAKRPLPMPE